MSPGELLHDLELVACCGVPPYTPDQLIDLLIDDDRVVAEGLRELAHPRRLTPEEGFALAAAARALLAVPGADDEGDLADVLAKLETVLGSSSLAVEVESSPALAPLQAALAAGEQVEIDLFRSLGGVSRRPVSSTRTRSSSGGQVVPGRLVPHGGRAAPLPDRPGEGGAADGAPGRPQPAEPGRARCSGASRGVPRRVGGGGGDRRVPRGGPLCRGGPGDQRPRVAPMMAGWWRRSRSATRRVGSAACYCDWARLIENSSANSLMKNNKPARRVGLKPLETGQIWRMAELNLQVGAWWANCSCITSWPSPTPLEVPTPAAGISTVEKYLKKNKAVLVSA